MRTNEDKGVDQDEYPSPFRRRELPYWCKAARAEGRRSPVS